MTEKILIRLFPQRGKLRKSSSLLKENFRNKIFQRVAFIILSLSICIPSFAQEERTVSGVVTDENGISIPGASIYFKNQSQIGTITNAQGEYSLAIPATFANPVLIFSFIGYDAQEVPLGNQSTINVQLDPGLHGLDEVVVVGYGTQSKRNISGAVGTIDSDAIRNLPVPSISEAMQGRAAGVQVIASGQPGADATFRIRGTGTINNANPLLVIDGVPTMSGLNQINMNDVETIQVLKDASAAAIYGSRGANGVVIITTKRGKVGTGSINLDVYTGFQQVANPLNMLNASQFGALHNEMMSNNGLDQRPDFSDPSALGAGTDWMGNFFQTAPMQNYSLSYSAGTEKSNIYVSASILDQQGVVMETGFKRYSVQINADTKVNDRIKFGNNLTLNHDVNHSGGGSIRNAMGSLPTQPIFNEDNSFAGPTGQPRWYGDIRNPIGEATLIKNRTSGYNMIGSLFGEIQLTEALSFKSTVGLQANLWDTRTWSPAYNWQPNPEPDAFLSQNYHKSITKLWDNYFTYDKVFNGVHSLNIMAGTSAQDNRFDFMGGSIRQFASESVQQLSNGTRLPSVTGNASDWALFSYMFRANYSYKDKYLFTGTVRRDGSSRFGEGNKWGVFPSGSFAWRISQEDFMSANDFFDDLKFRAGYGVTGNQEIGNYSFASTLNTVQYTFNGELVPAVVPVVMPNPRVQWESVEQVNLGLDATVFNGKLEIILDAYLKNTNNMLVPMAVPVSTGYSDIFVPQINAGSMQNRGIELTLSSVNLKRSDLTWTSDFNVSYNINEVLSLNDTIPMTTGGIGFNYNLARIQAGRPINEFFGYKTNGIFQTQEDVANYATQLDGNDPYNRTSAGDIRFMDVTNDGVINDDDRTFIGNPNPAFIFALNNTVSFKGFDLSVFLQGVAGNEIFNANRIWAEGMAVAQNQTTATLNRWTGPGTSNSMPRAVFNDPNNNTRASDRYIEDGSYLRIKNVTLGYTFGSSLIQKLGLQQARFYASAQNLLTFTNYTGIDPEVPVNGIDLNIYPVTRTITFGANLSF